MTRVACHLPWREREEALGLIERQDTCETAVCRGPRDRRAPSVVDLVQNLSPTLIILKPNRDQSLRLGVSQSLPLAHRGGTRIHICEALLVSHRSSTVVPASKTKEARGHAQIVKRCHT